MSKTSEERLDGFARGDTVYLDESAETMFTVLRVLPGEHGAVAEVRGVVPVSFLRHATPRTPVETDGTTREVVVTAEDVDQPCETCRYYSPGKAVCQRPTVVPCVEQSEWQPKPPAETVPGGGVFVPGMSLYPPTADLAPGDRVRHEHYGEGVVVGMEPCAINSDETGVLVKFPQWEEAECCCPRYLTKVEPPEPGSPKALVDELHGYARNIARDLMRTYHPFADPDDILNGKGAPRIDAPEWAIDAARQVDALLADAVKRNTGCETGYFSGVSINDIGLLIAAHCPHSKEEK